MNRTTEVCPDLKTGLWGLRDQAGLFAEPSTRAAGGAGVSALPSALPLAFKLLCERLEAVVLSWE